MLNRIALCLALALSFVASSRLACSQEVIHALTGTVSSIDPSDKTMTLFLDNGSQGTFKDMTNQHVSMSVDKKLLADTTTPDEFKKSGSYVIVFFFYGTDTRTVVALRSLGAGPFTATTGTVTKFEARHSISVQDKNGAMQTFAIDNDTVAEGVSGAVGGMKFQADKGDHVRVVGSTKGGTATALFVAEN